MTSLERQANLIWSTRAKVPNSLGSLENTALRFCSIQNTLMPQIKNPVLVLAASNHGIASCGVTVSSSCVTKQMFNLFNSGNGACAIMCRDNDVKLCTVDVGIDNPTNDFSRRKAMSLKKFRSVLEEGKKLADKLFNQGCNTVLLGEMGVGNTTSSGAIMHALTGIPSRYCASFNPDKDIFRNKINVIEKSLSQVEKTNDIYEICSAVGGYETVFLAGVVLGAGEKPMAVISDGFNTDVSVLIASKIKKDCLEKVFFSHCNGQVCHKKLQKYLKAEPIADIAMCLGEGSGALACIPLVKQGLSLFCNLDSFRKAKVDCNETQKRLPFAVGTTSYVLPADIRHNVKFLSNKVEDIELVLFESKGTSNIPDKKLISELTQTASEHNLSYTVHLPYDVKAGSRIEKERKTAVKTWLKFIEATENLPVHGYVLHLEPDSYDGNQPSSYEEQWKNCVIKSLTELVSKLKPGFDKSLICIETLGYDIMPYFDLIRGFGFSFTLDAGHLFKCGFYSKEYVKTLLPYTRIIHLHGVDEKGKDHRSLDCHRNKKELDEFLELLFEYERIPIVLTLEIFSEKDLVSSLEYLRKKEVFPCQKQYS